MMAVDNLTLLSLKPEADTVFTPSLSKSSAFSAMACFRILVTLLFATKYFGHICEKMKNGMTYTLYEKLYKLK